MAALSLRLSALEQQIIETKAKEAGLSKSEFARRAALDTEIESVLPKQNIVKALCTYHNLVDDAETLEDVRQITHELEDILYGCL